MKKISLLLFLFGALPVFGQGRDTVFAVHKLFRQRRGGAEGWMATGATTALDGSLGWHSVTRAAGTNAGQAIVAGSLPFAWGLRQALRFSPEREAQILQSYANGWPIPADIRRKLRRKHFRRTALDVTAEQ